MRTQTILREVANESRACPSMKEKKESPLSFLKDESRAIITAIHSIVLIKEMHWAQKQTIILFILNPRENAYFTWIEKLKEFPDDLLAVLSDEQIKLVNSCADWNDARLLTIKVQECPEWQAAFKDWKERSNIGSTHPQFHMHWAHGLARWRVLNKGKSHRKNIKGMVKVYAELKKDLKQKFVSYTYHKFSHTLRLANYGATIKIGVDLGWSYQFQYNELQFESQGRKTTILPRRNLPLQITQQQLLKMQNVFSSRTFQKPEFEIINNSNKHTQEKSSSSGNIKFADDDSTDPDVSIIEIPRRQENEAIEPPFVKIELNVREGEQPASFIDVNRQQINYGTTSQNRAQDTQQTTYFGVESSNDFNQYGIPLDPYEIPLNPYGAQLDQQHYGRNEDTSPPRGSAVILDAAYLASTRQQKERNLPNWSKRQRDSCALLANPDEAHDANYQTRSREQSAFSYVQQRSTSHAPDSLKTDYSFTQKPAEIQPAENEGKSFDKTNEQERNKNRAQVSVDISSTLKEGSDQKSQEEPRITTTDPVATKKESFVSQEEQSSVAQGVQPENKEESAQSNRNEKAEDKNCNSVQLENSTKQSSVLEEGSDQQSQKEPRITSTDPAVTSKGAEENNIKAMQKPNNRNEKNTPLVKKENRISAQSKANKIGDIPHESENKKKENQIYAQSKITEKDKKSSPNPTHSAENSPNNGQRGSSSYSDKLTDRVVGTPGKTQTAQSFSTGRLEENAQKSPRVYSQAMASSKRPPLQPFPRIAKKTAEISHYSPSINLTNQEGIVAYNLILVGGSNVGKTTLFNSSANYLLSESEAEAFGNPMFLSDVSFRVTENSRSELISVQANFKSEDGLGINNSQYPFMEEITYYDPDSGEMKMLRILDTPGINEEKGALNIENILKAAKLMGEIHGVGILIGPNEVLMKANFTLALNRLLGQFHKSAIKNLLFFYTKVSGPIYAPGDSYPLVENYLKAAKIDLPLDLENVFRFDNGWFRSLCIKQFNSKNGKMYEVPARTGWSHSNKEMERLMKRLSKSKEPYKMEESVFLDETKRFLEELAEPVSQCLLKYIEKSYEIEGIAKDRDTSKSIKDQPQLMVNGVKEEAELKKTFDEILKKCSQLAAFLQKNTIVPGIDPFLEHFTSLRDIEKEKDEFYRVKSHHLPKLQSTCEKYVAELNNAIYDVKKPNIEGIKAELIGMPHFKAIFFNAFDGKMKF